MVWSMLIIRKIIGKNSMKQDLEEIKNKIQRFHKNGVMHIGVAQRFVKNSAYWYAHPCGTPVHAPKHFNRVQNGTHGWEIEFGANKFLVQKAIEECLDLLCKALAYAEVNEEYIDCSFLRSEMEFEVSGAVSNYLNERFDYYWEIRDEKYLVFGVQSIRIDKFVGTMLDYVGIEKICKRNKPS